MPFLYSFCTWLSVRMGSIIVAAVSLVQAVTFLAFCIAAIKLKEILVWRLEVIKEENDLMFAEPYVAYLQNNVERVFTITTCFFITYIASCLLLLHGAYNLISWEIIPYIVMELVRLVILTILTSSLMLLIKRNVLDFNILIVCQVFSGFLILLLYYFWLCPVSLVQCMLKIRNKKMDVDQKRTTEKNELSYIYDYLSDFSFKPVMPNRNYYQYQYGNLPSLHF